MDVRAVRSEDRPSLEIVRKQALEESLSGAYPRRKFADMVATDAKHFQRWIDGENWICHVGVTEYSAVSFGVLNREKSTIEALYTAPSHQNHGWATTVLESLEASFGFPFKLTVRVPKSSMEFFKKKGFQETTTVEVSGMEWRRMKKSVEEIPANSPG